MRQTSRAKATAEVVNLQEREKGMAALKAREQARNLLGMAAKS
jgi:hypothetical protein